MPTGSEDDSEGGYWVNDDIEKGFSKNPQFCQSVQVYVMNSLSIPIDINLQIPPKKYRWSDEPPKKYKIRIVEKSHNKSEKQRAVSECIKKLFQMIKSKSIQYNDNKVLKWFDWIINTRGNLQFLQNLVNKKINDMIIVIQKSENLLCIYYSSYQVFQDVNTDKLEYFLQNEILQEIIPLPLAHERSPQLESELKKIEPDKTIEDEILIIRSGIFLKTKQKEIVLFGYDKRVNELKKKILPIIERNTLITYKLNPMNMSLIEYLLDTDSDALVDIENKHKHFGVDIRLRLHEFSSPKHLKDEIESSIQQLLSRSSTTNTKTFQSIPLFKTIAENQDKQLKLIAQNNSCYINTNLKHTYQSHSIPKALVSYVQISKSLIAQSELFCSSSDVFKKMIVENGSIELRTGDIALQEVHTIIISTTFNGLKEGLIDRAGQFDNEKTHLQSDGTMYTETNGGQLKCKRILFSNWIPTSLINNDKILQFSIQSFISKSIEYTKDASSIAFAVPDSCNDEIILAKEMIAEVKRQLEINKLELKISFVFLPEQKTLYEQFTNFFQTVENVYAYFDWPMTVIDITLIKMNDEGVTKCQERILKYLSRCINSTKITHPNGIFQSWDQHVINSFYKYCKDRCVLPKLDEIQNEIELIGSASGIQEAKKKWFVLSALVHSTSIIERPNSARLGAKLYNIVVSYNRKDARRCQRLMNRLTEEGFSIGTDSNSSEEERLQMDKCDCIILCISENYYQNSSCIEEAKYAFQTDKKVFLVKIQTNPLMGWDYDLFEGKLFFHLFGSEDYFDLEYGRLLIELLRYTKPGFASLLQRRTSFMQQDTNDIRKIKKVEKSVTSPRQLTFIEERWLHKLSNISKPNLSLYATSPKDPDDDKPSFKMLANSYKISDLSIQTILSPPKRCFLGYFDPECWTQNLTYVHRPIFKQPLNQISIDTDETYGKPTERNQSFTGLSQIFPPDHSTDDFIPHRIPMNFLDRYVSFQWSKEYIRTEKEMKQRQKFENPEEMKHVREKLAKYFMDRYKCYTEQQMNVYSKFAQRMKDNTMAFEMFCSTNTIAN